MHTQRQTYRSLVIQKAQQLAGEHGGLAKIPRSIQQRVGFEVISKRKVSSISVRIPEGDLSGRIAELKKELPRVSFESAKPDTETIFGKYTPVPSFTNPTMDDFWIMQGWYKQDRGGIKLTQAKWQDDEKVRAEAICFLVEKVLKKGPREILAEDFSSNLLGGLLCNYYKSSPYEALIAAGYAYSIQEVLAQAKTGSFQDGKAYPWELPKAPRDFYEEEENRIAAIRWLVWKLQKDPRDLMQHDFYSNHLQGLISHQYKGSPYEALIAAGYAYSPKEYLLHAETGSFQNEKVYPWELFNAPRFYESKENRVAAARWLVWKLQKDPRCITQREFYSNRLRGLLAHHKNSSYAAFLEAGAVTEEDEHYMRYGVHKSAGVP